MMSHDVMANKENILPFKANGKPSCNHKVIVNDMSSSKPQGALFQLQFIFRHYSLPIGTDLS